MVCVALSACTPRVFPFRLGAVVGSERAGEQQLVPSRLPSCSLNGALCRAGWWPALPGLPWGVPAFPPSPAPAPLCTPSPGHHQGPLPEGEVQPAQGVRGAGLPARHVHQPQEAGAQVGARRRRGRAAAGGKGGTRRGLSTLSPRAGSSRWAPRRTGAASPATPPRWPPSAAPTATPTARR